MSRLVPGLALVAAGVQGIFRSRALTHGRDGTLAQYLTFGDIDALAGAFLHPDYPRGDAPPLPVRENSP